MKNQVEELIHVTLIDRLKGVLDKHQHIVNQTKNAIIEVRKKIVILKQNRIAVENAVLPESEIRDSIRDYINATKVRFENSVQFGAFLDNINHGETQRVTVNDVKDHKRAQTWLPVHDSEALLCGLIPKILEDSLLSCLKARVNGAELVISATERGLWLQEIDHEILLLEWEEEGLIDVAEVAGIHIPRCSDMDSPAPLEELEPDEHLDDISAMAA